MNHLVLLFNTGLFLGWEERGLWGLQRTVASSVVASGPNPGIP